jgi:DNA-binding CsgD family transcriptional regulator
VESIHLASAVMVEAIGQPNFNEAMLEACLSAVKFESAVVFAFESQKRRPFCVATRCANPDVEAANELYIDKHFANCEILERLQRKRGTGRLSMLRQSAAEIVDPEYRRDLYEAPRIAHDLMLLDQVGPLYFNLELFRSEGSAPFSAEEEVRIREFWPLVLACIQKNARLANLPKFTPSQRAEQMKSLVKLFLDKGVSRREAQVCAYIALGHSTLATSLHMSVSANTVSTLRQRAYRKLGITCMNELFSLCLRSIDSALDEASVRGGMFEA